MCRCGHEEQSQRAPCAACHSCALAPPFPKHLHRPCALIPQTPNTCTRARPAGSTARLPKSPAAAAARGTPAPQTPNSFLLFLPPSHPPAAPAAPPAPPRSPVQHQPEPCSTPRNIHSSLPLPFAHLPARRTCSTALPTHESSAASARTMLYPQKHPPPPAPFCTPARPPHLQHGPPHP